ncbi:hypothetical protein AB0O39_36300 [Streptomyces anulatus]|uniref:hypothetical protein n=1 Tax=Streptomyces anulatus TaxID=1892 RepID=UPI00342111B8
MDRVLGIGQPAPGRRRTAGHRIHPRHLTGHRSASSPRALSSANGPDIPTRPHHDSVCTPPFLAERGGGSWPYTSPAASAHASISDASAAIRRA